MAVAPLHDDLALLQLGPFKVVPGGALLSAPDNRHGLKVLRLDRPHELLDRPSRGNRPRKGRARTRSAAARRYQYREKD